MNELELLKDSSRNEDFIYQPKNCDIIPGVVTESIKSFSGFATEAIKSNNNLAHSICKTNESMVNHYVSQSVITEESKERVIKYAIDSNERIACNANTRTLVEIGIGTGIGLTVLYLFSSASKNKNSSSNP